MAPPPFGNASRGGAQWVMVDVTDHEVRFTGPVPGTLGAVLYANEAEGLAWESEWVALVRAVSKQDLAALHALFERAHRPVCTLAERITGDRAMAEEVALDVFEDVWRRAWSYDPANNTVLGWIMNQARSRSVQRSQAPGRDTASRRSSPLEKRLAQRIARLTATDPVAPPASRWSEPDWDDVAPGISCKLLATDAERRRVSMFVRLQPLVEYPSHTHSGLEELHLLQGELWIDNRKLFPGDYNRAEAASTDKRVWSETGCTCVLVTSIDDVLS